jgi:hypothetical protein
MNGPAPVQASAQPAGDRTKVAAIGAAGSSHDGIWKMDMHVTTTNGNAVGGQWLPHAGVPLSFVNGIADCPSTKLRLTPDGGISGWILVPSMGTTAVSFIVNVSGRFEDDVFTGPFRGRLEFLWR